MSQWWILGKGLVRMTMTDGKYMYTHPTHIHTHRVPDCYVFYCFGNIVVTAVPMMDV